MSNNRVRLKRKPPIEVISAEDVAARVAKARMEGYNNGVIVTMRSHREPTVELRPNGEAVEYAPPITPYDGVVSNVTPTLMHVRTYAPQYLFGFEVDKDIMRREVRFMSFVSREGGDRTFACDSRVGYEIMEDTGGDILPVFLGVMIRPTLHKLSVYVPQLELAKALSMFISEPNVLFQSTRPKYEEVLREISYIMGWDSDALRF